MSRRDEAEALLIEVVKETRFNDSVSMETFQKIVAAIHAIRGIREDD